MALSGSAADRKLVDQFLAQGGPQDASGYLGTLNQNIAQGKEARLAAQRANRAIGGGPWAGNSPFKNTPQLSPSGAGGRAVMQQGLGPVPPVPGQGPLALPSASRGLPAVPGPSGVAVPSSPPIPAIGPGPQAAGALGPGPGVASSPAPGPGQLTTAATKAASQSADELLATSGRAAASGVDDVAAAAAREAGTVAAASGPVATRSAAMSLGINITKAGVMRGAGVAGAGLMASQFFDGMDLGGENSALDRGGSGALLGAGLGGGAAIALGLGAGPVGWAALGGAALFAGYKVLWGDKKTSIDKMTESVGDTRESITSLGQMYGLDNSAMQDILLQYDASTRLYLDNKDKDGLKNFMAGMGAQLPAMMLGAREQQKAQEQQQQRYNDMIAAQAQFAPIFERSLDRASQASQTAFATANSAAGVLEANHPNLAALYRQTAAQSQASSANLQAAYAKQMASTPRQANNADELQRMMAQEQMLNQALTGVG